jgi:adenosylcobinamide kinase / adenosylcobinamide-phosphate guanylyltransferase
MDEGAAEALGEHAMLIFISGGVRSGKSALGERYIANSACNRKVYLATSEIYDEEMAGRIARHRQDRAGKGFVTIEKCRDIGAAGGMLNRGDAVLLDCLGTLVANEMFGEGASCGESKDSLVQRIYSDILCIRNAVSLLVVVSNEVFSDGVQFEQATEDYIDTLGKLHCLLAAEADEAIECACGFSNKHKG